MKQINYKMENSRTDWPLTDRKDIINQAIIKERKKLKGVRGIAKFLECSPGTVQKMLNNHRFKVYRIGRLIYAYSDEIEDSIRQDYVPISQDAAGAH